MAGPRLNSTITHSWVLDSSPTHPPTGFRAEESADLRIGTQALIIDLNADVGESFGVSALGQDAALIRNVTSASVACGFHTGDPGVIRRTVRLGLAAGVAIGAHPGFPDRAGCGRREMHVSTAEIEDLVLYQVAALAGIVAAEGGRLRHVKAHGALYNMAARDRRLADAIVRAVAAFDRSLVLFGLAGSEMLAAGRAAGLRVAGEVFPDRAYAPDGTLVAREVHGSVMSDPPQVVARALRMVHERCTTAVDGATVPLDFETMCVHSDTPDAAELTRQVRAALEGAGVVVKAVGIS